MSGQHAEENEDDEDDDVIFLGELPVNRWREASEACAAADAEAVAGNGTSSSTLYVGLQAGLLSTPCLSWDKQIPSLRSTPSRRRRSPGDHIATGMAHGRVTCLRSLKV